MSDNSILTNHQINQNRILRADEVALITGLSRTTIWRLEKFSDFPSRRLLSPGTVGWFAREVEAWLASRQIVSTEPVKPVKMDSKRGHWRKPHI